MAILPEAHASTHPRLAAWPHDYQRQNALATTLALAGFDVASDAGGGGGSAPAAEAGATFAREGHSGLAALLTIRCNDEATRAALSSALLRAAAVVRQCVCGEPYAASRYGRR